LDLPPENFQSIAQVATEILNISCAKLIIELQEFFLATKIVILRSPACNCRKKMSLLFLSYSGSSDQPTSSFFKQNI
jgi:hypothetical protein